jgi:hypothetical protein
MPKDKYFPFLRTYALFLLFVFSSALAWCLPANAPKSRPTGPRDTLTFKNGDTLQGKLDREVSGTVYFQSDELGEINVPWSKIQSLHTQAGYVVLENKPGVRIRHATIDASRGALSVGSNEISVSPGDAPPPLRAHDANARAAHGGTIVSRGSEPIPVGDAQYILDERTFNRQLRENPDIFAGWNGSATAGVTLVQGTENQYTYTSAIALVRTVPTVDWLVTRNRMSADFSSSYGKITQPAYRSGGALIPTTYTKTSIFHADAERDQYLSNRAYGLAQTAFDHNFSQGLDLQQIYGIGFGFTAIKRQTQQLDFKASLQYEKQIFIASASGTNQNLIGSTVSGTYSLKLPKGTTFNQQIAYVPAFNVTHAYSANETDTLIFPFYKNLAFSVGTIDSYLNDPVAASPPNTRNSFQFTTGITYTVRSKY